MSLENEHQVRNTPVRLARLEARYEALLNEPDTNVAIRQLSKESLAGLIKQPKEEIATFKSWYSLALWYGLPDRSLAKRYRCQSFETTDNDRFQSFARYRLGTLRTFSADAWRRLKRSARLSYISASLR